MQINSAKTSEKDGTRHEQQLKIFRLNYRSAFALGRRLPKWQRHIIIIEEASSCMCVACYLQNIISSICPILAGTAVLEYFVVDVLLVSLFLRACFFTSPARNFRLVLRKTGWDVKLKPDASRTVFEQAVLFQFHFNHRLLLSPHISTSLFPSARRSAGRPVYSA